MFEFQDIISCISPKKYPPENSRPPTKFILSEFENAPASVSALPSLATNNLDERIENQPKCLFKSAPALVAVTEPSNAPNPALPPKKVPCQ